MTGAKMRVPLDLPGQTGVISLCNLVPGNTYSAIANGIAYGQTTVFDLRLKGVAAAQASKYPNIVRFTATAECVDLQVKTSDVQENSSVPMCLSVQCETCPEVNAWKQNLVAATGAAVLEVEGGQTAEELVSEVLIDGECFDVENVTFAGQPAQFGTFSNGATNVGFSDGIIIATGNINVAPGPNFDDGDDNGINVSTPDSDLSTLTNGNIRDRASIEFDFTPTETPVSFQFVFASEEYCEYVFSQFNDVFGFFISGPGIVGTKNIAIVPGTMPPVPITINTINHETNEAYYVNNQPAWSLDLCGQSPSNDPAVFEIQYDGFTLPLVAVADVIPCQTYHIKLKIADVADSFFDSAVFLKAGSFNAGGDATVDFVVNDDPDVAEASEGCDQVALRIDRVGSSNLSQPVTVSFSVGGSATPGVDYLPFDSTYTIPPGQNELIVPVTILSDLLAEDPETITLLLDNSCSCDVTAKTLTILDYTPSSGDTTFNLAICKSGDSITLTADPLGGTAPFTYLWSNNDTTSSIFVNPNVTTSYAVTIVDVCSDTTVNYFLVEVLPLAEIVENISFCAGKSVAIGDSVYTQSTTVMDTLAGLNGACDTIFTYNLTLLPYNTASDTIAFCFGDSVEINGIFYSEAGVVMDTISGTGGGCDTILTWVLEVLPLNATADTITFCPGSSVALGDSVYSQPTTVTLVLPGANGACDTLATYVLELKSQAVFTDSIAFCPGSSVVINGEIYSQSGIVQDTLPGANGACDTLATYVLTLLPQISFTDTITFCPGDTVFVNGNFFTAAGIYPDTLPGANGACDTLATYLLVSLTPAPSEVKIICPDNLTVTTEPPVTIYDAPEATTDCACPGISVQLTAGLPSGSVFPPGVTEVCYQAKDSCGNSALCCFEVMVPEEEPCDEATIGCVKYELVGISEDAAGNNTYRIRVTNNCTNKLMFAAFSLPSGVVALSPANNSIYVAPSGREYSVRNPNYSPFYSIRFKSDQAGIAGGESDLFEFTLPALANPSNIQVIVRVEPKIFYQTYLHTSGCTIEQEPKPVQSDPVPTTFKKAVNPVSVFPNPSAGTLFADLSEWKGEQVNAGIFDSRGQLVQQVSLIADVVPQELQLSQDLPNGLYFLEISSENGEKQAVRFVLQRF
ncbi:MAG: hypothetical protein OHK0019_13550 [Saprospiraceae bacterium]